MRSGVERSLVAKVGGLVFVLALGLPATLSSASARVSVLVAGAVVDDVAAVDDVLSSSAVAPPPRAPDEGWIPLAELRIPAAAAPTPAVAEPAPAPAPPVAVLGVAAPTFPPPPPLVLDGTVIASWYGPGFYGNRTACGQTYTPEILGVAHRTLPCGTGIRITSPAGITVTVPVIDRGPYIAGRSLDLSNATRAALQCSDLCRVRMVVIQ